ncbi:hypothetical protein pb186bvf_013453 [Paramecium bursaria]
MNCIVKTVHLHLQALQKLNIKFGIYKLEVYFGGAKQITKELKYYYQQDEIPIETELELQSIQGKDIEFWLVDNRGNFIGNGEYTISNEQLVLSNLKIDGNIVAVLQFVISFTKEDIYEPTVLENDNEILKKDDSELIRQQQEQAEREAQLKREQEEQELLRQEAIGDNYKQTIIK